MPRHNKRSGRKNNQNTRIHVSFKAIIEPSWTADTGTGGGGFQSIPLNAAITELTKDLGIIYKLYRFVNVRLDFQADPNPSTTLATGKPTYVCMNYIPAKEQPITTWPNPLNLEKFEGPAIGFYAANRGHPYTYHVPKAILLSMPYNWYETKQNTPEFSDYTQGQIFLKTTDANYYAPILAHFTVEFQTMEDPEFLSNLTKKAQPEGIMCMTKKVVEDIEIEDCVSIYSRCNNPTPRLRDEEAVKVDNYCRASRF
jgi:hypothetical protein